MFNEEYFKQFLLYLFPIASVTPSGGGVTTPDSGAATSGESISTTQISKEMLKGPIPSLKKLRSEGNQREITLGNQFCL